MGRRVVTVRQLTRDLPAILDVLSTEEAPVTITRRGVPVAELRPVRVIPWALTEVDVACGSALPDVDLDALDLSADQRTVLRECREGHIHGDAYDLLGSNTGRAGLALAHLEIKGLVLKDWGGYRFTDLGRDVAQVLRAQSEPDPS